MVIKRITQSLFFCCTSLLYGARVECTFVKGVNSARAADVIKNTAILNEPNTLAVLLNAGVTSTLAQQVEGEGVAISPFVSALNDIVCGRVVVVHPENVSEWFPFPEPDIQKQWVNELFLLYDHLEPRPLGVLSPSFVQSRPYAGALDRYLGTEADLIEGRDRLHSERESLAADREALNPQREIFEVRKHAFTLEKENFRNAAKAPISAAEKSRLAGWKRRLLQEKDALEQLALPLNELEARSESLRGMESILSRKCRVLEGEFKDLYKELHKQLDEGFIYLPQCAVLLTRGEESSPSAIAHSTIDLIKHCRREVIPSKVAFIGDAGLVSSVGAAFVQVLESEPSSINDLHLIGFTLPAAQRGSEGQILSEAEALALADHALSGELHPLCIGDMKDAKLESKNARIRTPIPVTRDTPPFPVTRDTPPSPKGSPNRDESGGRRGSLGSSPQGRMFHPPHGAKKLDFETTEGARGNSSLQRRTQGMFNKSASVPSSSLEPDTKYPLEGAASASVVRTIRSEPLSMPKIDRNTIVDPREKKYEDFQ